jgi:hypothetical protein
MQCHRARASLESGWTASPNAEKEDEAAIAPATFRAIQSSGDRCSGSPQRTLSIGSGHFNRHRRAATEGEIALGLPQCKPVNFYDKVVNMRTVAGIEIVFRL